MAVTFVRSELARWVAESATSVLGVHHVRHAMDICITHANQSIYNAANANPQFHGMGTTIVAGIFSTQRVVIGHVGDSRCYRWRDNTLVQLTKDHSLLQEQLDAGLISPEQAKIATHKNLVTRALGVEDQVNVAVQETTPQLGDVYMMCSDGLSDMLEDAVIAQYLSSTKDLSLKARDLVRAANEAGGRDNVSVLLIQAKETTDSPSFFSRILRKS
jgi:protein phosphatase